MSDTEKSQKEVAAAIERTARQVSNLTRDGVFARVPSATDPATLVYPWPETLERWVKYSATQQTNAQRRAKKSDQEKSARTRAAIADAEMSEFRLQQLRGEWVKKEDFARELRTILGAIAAVLDVAPGKYASRLPAEIPMIDRVTAMRSVVDEIRRELRRVGGTPALEATSQETTAA